MTTFLTTLRTLDAAATKGPWGCLDLRLVEVERLSIMGADEDSIVARIENNVSSRPLSHEDEANAAILIHLRNHAAAIIGCVEAARGAADALGKIEQACRGDIGTCTCVPARAALTNLNSALAALEWE